MSAVVAVRQTLAGEWVRLRSTGHLECGATELCLGIVPTSVMWGALDALQWIGLARVGDVVLASRQCARSRLVSAQVMEQSRAIIRAVDTGSVYGRRLEMRDGQHILHCRDPWCRVCREGGAWRFT